jgi:type I site-specific restriction endonuclease
MDEEKSCEDHIANFCKWVYSSIFETSTTQENVEIAKDILKQVLPEPLADLVDEAAVDTGMVHMDLKKIMLLMPEFATKFTETMDNICPMHKGEMIEMAKPLLDGFADVIMQFSEHGAELRNQEKEEAEEADKRFKGIDDISLN